MSSGEPVTRSWLTGAVAVRVLARPHGQRGGGTECQREVAYVLLWRQHLPGRSLTWTLRCTSCTGELSDTSRGAAAKIPFGRRRYVLARLALAALERAEAQVTRGWLVDRIVAFAADPSLTGAGITFTLNNQEERLQLAGPAAAPAHRRDRLRRRGAGGGHRVFAAASAHYRSAHPDAPRLVLLDEAFAAVDDDARAKRLGLPATFGLDVVMPGEREWGFYATVPGIATHQLVRRGVPLDGTARRGRGHRPPRSCPVADECPATTWPRSPGASPSRSRDGPLNHRGIPGRPPR